MTGSTQSYAIEAMTMADVDEVAALEAQVQRFPWSRQSFLEAMQAGNQGRLVRSESQLLAFALTLPAVDELELLRIAVAEAQQRQGIARALLQDICLGAQQQRMKRILLEVAAENHAALGFYQHSGFVEIGRRRAYYQTRVSTGDKTGEDAIVMALNLSTEQ